MAHSSHHPSQPCTPKQKSTHSTPHILSGCDIGNTHTSIICRLYRAKVEEAVRLIRPDWTITLDGAVYGPRNWQPLTQDEAEELHDLIDMIDVDAILAAATR